VVSLRTARFNIKKFYMVLALRSVFCTDLRTDSDFFFVHHEINDFYKRGGKYLQRGRTDSLCEADCVSSLKG